MQNVVIYNCQGAKGDKKHMKVKTTRKALISAYPKAISIGYCGAQYLLQYQDPYYYTCGTYGWNCDGYVINDILLTTGYRGLVGDSVNYKLLETYEKQAEKISLDYSLNYEERKEKVNTLLYEFIEKTTKEDH